MGSCQQMPWRNPTCDHGLRAFGMQPETRTKNIVAFLWMAEVMAAVEGANLRNQQGWSRIVTGTSILVLLLCGVAFAIWAVRAAKGTHLQAGAAIVAWISVLIGLASTAIALTGDQNAFFGTLAGIGAGIVTQAAFHYGFVANPKLSAQARHASRTQALLARTRRR